ncbi:MAG TPA: hypothetical protein VH583_19800 [Vicinamibacterales bacterium]|jgi:hypothetical protein
MKTATLYRAAAILFVLFAAGHTVGFLEFRPNSPEGLAVRDAMNSVHFSVRGAEFSYGGFYVGFGLFVTAYLLFSAVLAWQLGTLARSRTPGLDGIAWSFFAVQIASLILSWVFFSAPPGIFSGLVAVCLGIAAWGTSSDRAVLNVPQQESA